ncbi:MULTISPECIES: hypothetical protein [unclassified Companilactobacillus]|jgi:hypothetical protein
MDKNNKKIDVDKLSSQAKKKLKEIQLKHNFKSMEEAAQYMLDFTKEQK